MLKKIKIPKTYSRILTVAVLAIFVFSLIQFFYKPKVEAIIYLTSGTTWTVPSDWSNLNNSIEAIGGGGGGGGGATNQTGGGGGGGAGAYSKATNVSLSPGSTVGISVGSGGAGGGGNTTGGTGGDTYICSATTSCATISDASVVVGAAGGQGGGFSNRGGRGGNGGKTTSGTGGTLYNGGNGANGGGHGGGGGGGGGGGMNGAGNNGTNTGSSTGGNGGSGDAGFGGAGGSGSGSGAGGTGGNGTEWDASHGSGGGGGGGVGVGNRNQVGGAGGAGGVYGAGGAGGGGSHRGTGGTGGNGYQGVIVIKYFYTSQSDYRWRNDDGTESTGTPKVSQDTQATTVGTTPVRLRFLVSNRGDSVTYSFLLQYAPYTTSCGSWTTVPATATTQAFNMYNTTYYSDQTASTNVTSGPGVITDPSGYTFTPGLLVKYPSDSASVTLGSHQFTEIEYAIQANSNATYESYCFRVTNNGTALENYSNYPILNINYPPSTPTIYIPASGATNVSLTPTFELKSTDYNSDYLNYVLEVCPTNSWPCASGGHTYDETSSQACWSGQDTQSETAYSGAKSLSASAMAYCTMPPSDRLSPSTTYYARAKAIDPGGSDTFSSYSSVVSFTTGSLLININGGTTITGGTDIGN